MRLLTLESLRAIRLSKDKSNKKLLASKQLEFRLEKELQDKLESLLEHNDRALLEVDKRVLGEFLNIVDRRIASLYDYEQVDSNKFIFSSKEIFL